jgi:crossover junction endodeoxyribonuclease RuvC
MKVVGVDPGLRVSGYAVVEQGQKTREIRVLDAGVIKADDTLELEKRLGQIYNDIDALLNEHEVDIMAVEELYAHYEHPRTAILMGHARGMFLLAAANHGVKVVSFAATRIKKCLTGHGRASKQQMQHAVAQQLKLGQVPRPADVADALAIAMCCVNEYDR